MARRRRRASTPFRKTPSISTVTAISCTGPTIMFAAPPRHAQSCVCARPDRTYSTFNRVATRSAPQGGRRSPSRSGHQGAFSSPWFPPYWEPRWATLSVAVGAVDRRSSSTTRLRANAHDAGPLLPLPTTARSVRDDQLTRSIDTSKPQPPDYGKSPAGAVRHSGQASAQAAYRRNQQIGGPRLGQPRTRWFFCRRQSEFRQSSVVRRRSIGVVARRSRGRFERRHAQRPQTGAAKVSAGASASGVVAKLDLTAAAWQPVERHRHVRPMNRKLHQALDQASLWAGRASRPSNPAAGDVVSFWDGGDQHRPGRAGVHEDFERRQTICVESTRRRPHARCRTRRYVTIRALGHFSPGFGQKFETLTTSPENGGCSRRSRPRAEARRPQSDAVRVRRPRCMGGVD